MNISDPEFHLQTALTLPENEVHLWRLDVEPLAVSEDRWQQLLSADEQVRASRLRRSGPEDARLPPFHERKAPFGASLR